MKEFLKQAILYKARYYILIVVLVAGMVAVIAAIMAAIVDDDSGGSGPGGYGPLLCTQGELNMEYIDKKFADLGVFTGKQDVFIEAATNNNIDPVLLMSIAMHETSYGKSPAVKNKNNPGGLMRPKGGLMTFATLEEGIEFMAGNLNRLYISQGLVTIEQVGNKYAPVGAKNDPNNLNAHWIPTVTRIANSFGGLSANCEYAASGDYAYPVTPPLVVTSHYGMRTHPVTGKPSTMHKGTDLACSIGDPIYAVDNGTIAVAIKAGGGNYGHHIIINHGNRFTLYGHMTAVHVSVNQDVKKGEQIGTCGKTGRVTGPHLHFEIQTGDIYGTREDPWPFLQSIGREDESNPDEGADDSMDRGDE
ncbi:peptidoglycan DD-metalloendopeptidase family protein (plasmid) [Paenibacillus peoriae]|uniref:Peptidoglycan DD-metalloendopeptidase family protein n=1 Tax=Paenibacillus peoriae TaxID=59893 RepID=A0A7H0YHH2_9BACL|nr:peptidoglycan DD-metalloendopeptidase family protein [Paenibacillus peoriae]QNR70530.1 peptidoglycan DD-metalloendopeptidase family protein [Paenibacillus peoriae]